MFAAVSVSLEVRTVFSVRAVERIRASRECTHGTRERTARSERW